MGRDAVAWQGGGGRDTERLYHTPFPCDCFKLRPTDATGQLLAEMFVLCFTVGHSALELRKATSQKTVLRKYLLSKS